MYVTNFMKGWQKNIRNYFLKASTVNFILLLIFKQIKLFRGIKILLYKLFLWFLYHIILFHFFAQKFRASFFLRSVF